MRVTAVIPTYNEAENLPKLVSALFVVEPELRIVVVDDQSPDGTGPIAEELARRDERLSVVLQAGKSGLGSAYLNGFQRALEGGAEAVLQIDADFSHDPARLPDMVQQLAEADLVLGSRYVPGGSVDRNWPAWRRALSAFGSLYSRLILDMPVHDTTTGFRLWRAETLRGLPLGRVHSSGYVFQVEMAYLAYCLDYRIVEIPIYFSDRQQGRSKMSFEIQLEAALRVWQVLWNDRDLRRQGQAARLTAP